MKKIVLLILAFFTFNVSTGLNGSAARILTYSTAAGATGVFIIITGINLILDNKRLRRQAVEYAIKKCLIEFEPKEEKPSIKKMWF